MFVAVYQFCGHILAICNFRRPTPFRLLFPWEKLQA